MKKSLEARKILVTRAESQSESMKEAILSEGGQPILLPLIEMQALEDRSEVHAAFEWLDTIDWLVFTSANAVHYFFRYAAEYGLKFYFYPNLKIATVGEKTKMALEQLGYRTNFVPIEYTAEVLAANMDEHIEGKRILIPRSSQASNEYLKVFEDRKAHVMPLCVYKNKEILHEKHRLEEILEMQIDSLLFTSGSTIRSFVNNFRTYKLNLPQAKVFCIGPSTAKVAAELGLEVNGVANPHTEEGLLETLKMN